MRAGRSPRSIVDTIERSDPMACRSIRGIPSIGILPRRGGAVNFRGTHLPETARGGLMSISFAMNDNYELRLKREFPWPVRWLRVCSMSRILMEQEVMERS
jgi:hypothetical protein